MRVLWRKSIICYTCGVALLGNVAIASARSQEKLLSAEEAIAVGRRTSEAKAFYALDGGRFQKCIHAQALKPCESNWVTCIDDAWVVKFTVAPECLAHNDGRVSETLLIDARTAKILSRFPESPYFQKPKYCHDDYDCLSAQRNGKDVCLNFIYGQIAAYPYTVSAKCVCVRSVCRVKADAHE